LPYPENYPKKDEIYRSKNFLKMPFKMLVSQYTVTQSRSDGARTRTNNSKSRSPTNDWRPHLNDARISGRYKAGCLMIMAQEEVNRS